MFDNKFDPLEVLQKLVESNNATQAQLKVVDKNLHEIAKAHNELRHQVIKLDVRIENLLQKIEEMRNETARED